MGTVIGNDGEQLVIDEPCGAQAHFWDDPEQRMWCGLPKGHAGPHFDEDYNCEWDDLAPAAVRCLVCNKDAGEGRGWCDLCLAIL